MRNKNWRQVETIFHAAIALGGEERILYLSKTCSGDAALLSEVESLINAFENESEFLEDSAFDAGMNVLGQSFEKDLTGETIGIYEIRKRLGGGGMGDVYLADDTKLHRKVALKFLRGDFAGDIWAKRQFEKEAQAVAKLEHDNICAVHSIEEFDEHNFIVMQFVEGETLGQFISRQELDLEKILSIAHQIVSAVAEAHSHGIIHRDIKPGNIMINSDGKVKVLDFGLAKIVEQKQKERSDEHSHFSQAGLIMGTVSYMSPEQLKAETLDFRSDIFSVGIVLYEMLARSAPFTRASQAETIAAILEAQPQRLNGGAIKVPETLNAIIQRCLNKNREKRFESATALLIELENFKEGITVSSKAQKIAALYRHAAFIFLFAIMFGIGWLLFLRSGKIPKLAVLPVANESQQAEKDYLSEGLTTNLIDKFSHLSGMKVVAQPFAAQYKGVDPQIAGKELNADVVMVGKIVRQNDNFILKISLMDVSEGTAILNEDYNLDNAQMIDIQQQISSRVIEKLQPSLSDDEMTRVEKPQTGSSEALDLYNRGRFYWNRRDVPGNMEKAIDLFTKSTEADPLFALAWAGLADSYALANTSSFKNPLSPRDAAINAKYSANEAIQKNSELAAPHVSLGIIKSRYDWDWQGAENDFKKAISIDPGYAPAYLWYSRLLALMKRYDEALVYSEKARELEPLSIPSQDNSGQIYFYLRNYAEASRIYMEVFGKNPDSRRVKNEIACLFLQTNKVREAIALFESFRKEGDDYGLAGLGYGYAVAGRRSEALGIIDELDKISETKRPVSSQERAIVYIGLGDKDKAFENLNRACEERYAALPQLLAHDPLTDSLRSDPRFAGLLRCVNLPVN